MLCYFVILLYSINADKMKVKFLILLIICAKSTKSKQVLDTEKFRYHATGDQHIRINSDPNQKKIHTMKNDTIHFKTNYQGKWVCLYGYI